MLQELRFAFRMLWKQPVFSLITALTLALGIGATSAVFSLIQAVLLTPPPYQKPEQLVLIPAARTDGQNMDSPRGWAAEQWMDISAIARRWRFGRTLAKIQQVYPTTGLFILLLAFAALFGYQNGNSWAKSNLIVALVVLCLGWSIIAMLVGAIIRANEVGRKLIPLALPALVTALSLVFAAYAATHGRITFSQDIRYSQIQELNRKLSEGESTVLRLEPTIRSNTDSSGPL